MKNILKGTLIGVAGSYFDLEFWNLLEIWSLWYHFKN